MLRPSMLDDLEAEAGTIRWSIQLADHLELPKKQQRHQKSYRNFPDTDVRPPEGIFVVALNSVQFSMVITESKQRTRAINKRQKAPLQGVQSSQVETMPIKDDQTEEVDVLLHDTCLSTYEPHILHATSTANLESQKRKRSKKFATIGLTSSLAIHSEDELNTLYRRPFTVSILQPKAIPSLAVLHQAEIERLVDGALRFSVSGSFSNRSVHGLRVKANTFFLGLADICPALWRPNYLRVRSSPFMTMKILTISRHFWKELTYCLISHAHSVK